MLSDPTQSEAFRRSSHWRSPLLDFRIRVGQPDRRGGGPAFRSNSFSGGERNRLLLAAGGGRFVDRTLVSGVGCREDARSFAVFDFDADGWLDIALASANAPRLRLFRNRIGEVAEGGRVVDVRLVGAGPPLSNRDGIGAVVTAVGSEGTRVFRRSAGEGLSSQNSPSVRVTLAPGEVLRRLTVRWPSGKVSEFTGEEVPAAGPLVVREG